MNQEERLLYLIQALLEEQPEHRELAIPSHVEDQKKLLRSLFNIRPPMPADDAFLQVQDAYLQEETRAKGIADVADLIPVRDNLYLWRGDITTLSAGAIANAANNRMLGCFVPCHGCIDNAIHTYAGIQLRLACDALMRRQGRPEETGTAKITPAFNLPSSHVLHTVGPIISGHLRQEDCDLLASCYRSCLELAEENAVDSVAFCCISTGEYRFPNEAAAEIAIQTVGAYISSKQSKIKVIFNVFKEADHEIYKRYLGANR